MVFWGRPIAVPSSAWLIPVSWRRVARRRPCGGATPGRGDRAGDDGSERSSLVLRGVDAGPADACRRKPPAVGKVVRHEGVRRRIQIPPNRHAQPARYQRDEAEPAGTEVTRLRHPSEAEDL